MQLGWIDFSRNERNRILQTLKMLNETDTLDELGIGVIRDSFSDLMFPGISTLQTRAKYFMLIPYLFSAAEKQSFKNSNEVLPWLHKQEDKLVPVLKANSLDTTGIIGIRALSQGKTVKVKPSVVYWSGLKTFGILRDSRLSLPHVCNAIFYRAQSRKSIVLKTEGRGEDKEGYDDQSALFGDALLFSDLMPDYPFMDKAAIELTKKEAEFLYLKMTQAMAAQGSLLAYMLKNHLFFDSFQDIDVRTLSGELAHIVELAKQFAHFISGAHIRYNVIFSNGEDTEQLDRYRMWQQTFDFNNFDLNGIFSTVQGNPSVLAFVKDFLEAAKTRDDKAVDQIIVRREKSIKGDRAKLFKPTEYRYDKPVHDRLLSYRYGTAATIMDDIFVGLEG